MTWSDLDSLGIRREELSGIANFLNKIEGAKIIFVIYAGKDHRIDVNLRTRDDSVDVSFLAKRLGGGGHLKASGFSVSADFDENNSRLI